MTQFMQSDSPNGDCKRVAWISGQSDPKSCRLSTTQFDFLKSLDLPDWEIFSLNFPYEEQLDRDQTHGSIIRASLHNGSQFAADTLGVRRRRLKDVLNFLQTDVDELILIAGSCGMQMLLEMKADFNEKVRVIGLGPVGWRIPRCPHLLVQGDQDFISRLFYRTGVVRILGQRHLNYQTNPKVIAATNHWICNNILK